MSRWSTPVGRGPGRVVRFVTLVCWVVWMLVAALSVAALLLSGQGATWVTRGDVLSVLVVVTGCCVGLPLAVGLLVRAVEGYGARRPPPSSGQQSAPP